MDATPPVEPHMSLYSSSGCAAKLTCFIGEAHEHSPTVVVKAMGRQSDGWWLRGEVDNLRAVRSRLCGETAQALLDPPLFAGELGGEYLVVETYEAFDGWCDRSPRASVRAHDWLRDFQRSTTTSVEPWLESDTAGAVSAVLGAWQRLRPDSAGLVARSSRRAFDSLGDTAVPRCATHGDFAPPNLAERSHRLKVLDWEWSGLDGGPWFDLWTYQLAELHTRLSNGGGPDIMDEQMDCALRFVEGELEAGDADPRVALATLPAVLSELVSRFRRVLGPGGLWELSSGDLMAVVERLLGRHDDALFEERGHPSLAGAPRS
jgi:hypothetical protein